MELASSVAVLILLVLSVQPHLPSGLSVSVKGSVSCMDCTRHNYHHLAGIRVALKCNHLKEMEFTKTDGEGHFDIKIPPAAPSPATDCALSLLGGPEQLCAFRRSIVSKVVRSTREGSESEGSASYTTSTPLSFFTSCNKLGSSKTVDFPLLPPGGWELSPPDYNFFRFLPIIGIP